MTPPDRGWRRRDFLTLTGAGLGWVALGMGCRDAAPSGAALTPLGELTRSAPPRPPTPVDAGRGGDDTRPEALMIDLFHDTVCPWCRIGHARLRAVLADWDGPVAVRYRPFLLEADTPPEGYDLRERLARKYGAASLDDMFARVTAIGRQEGLDFRFERIDRTPDTTLSHALIAHAPEAARPAVVDAIHDAYFTRGEDIGHIDILTACAEAAGLPAAPARAALSEPGTRARIRELARQSARGIRGVPHFVFGESVTVQGAQPAATLRDALARAAG